MIGGLRGALPASLAAVALIAAGCQSTQDKSREIAESLGPVKQEKGLEIDQASKDVEVVDTALLTGESSSAVVVRLRNNSERELVDVPIAIDVLDAKGKSTYKNDIPGLEPALTSMPLLAPGEEADWVHDQVLPLAEPDSVEVEVGASEDTLGDELPEVEVSDAVLGEDPISGVIGEGVAINHSDEQIPRLLIYAVARQGDAVVAAGRAAIEEMRPEKRFHYSIFFVGDPTGAEIAITHYPSPEAK